MPLVNSIGADSTNLPGEDPGSLRIGDSDRDQIAEVLSEHVAEGRLSMDELDQRLGTLYQAQTRAQAAALVADLPALAPAEAPEHFHLGHEHKQPRPTLPDWLTHGQWAQPAPVPARTAPAPPVGAHEDRAALRRRAKLRQDENAIGHTFQATRRAISEELESARASGDADGVQRASDRLKDAKKTAEEARQAVAAGDRATVQRLLARLRGLG